LAHRFPNERDIRYSAVSGFIFLRYFCPAILGPKLFGLRTEFADANTSRTLTLATKVLQVRWSSQGRGLRRARKRLTRRYPLAGPDTRQNLANLVDFGMKEPYMLEMNDFIREKREMMMVRRRHVAGVLLPSVVIPHGLHRSGPNRARCRATSTRWC